MKYRPVGLGVSGYHHMLAKKGVLWECEDHLKLVDRIFEDINFAAVKASCENAREKGSYAYFQGSEWEAVHILKSGPIVSERLALIWKIEVKTEGCATAIFWRLPPQAVPA